MTTATLDALGAAKYISLTTYRKDGTPVATPVWLAPDGDALVVMTDPDSGKVKRLRNNPSVLVSPCDMRGRVKPGAISVAGVVELQDAAATSRTEQLISKRYGLMGKIFTSMNERRARKAGKQVLAHQGLRITLTEAAPSTATG
jgi:PPOX class probable F420-dependent enzyme